MKIVVHLGVARGLALGSKKLLWYWLCHTEEVYQVTCYHKEASEVLDPMTVCLRLRKDADRVDGVFKLVQESLAAVQWVDVAQSTPKLRTLLGCQAFQAWPGHTSLRDPCFRVLEHCVTHIVDTLIDLRSPLSPCRTTAYGHAHCKILVVIRSLVIFLSTR